jgi:hypothetical protein
VKSGRAERHRAQVLNSFVETKMGAEEETGESAESVRKKE